MGGKAVSPVGVTRNGESGCAGPLLGRLPLGWHEGGLIPAHPPTGRPSHAAQEQARQADEGHPVDQRSTLGTQRTKATDRRAATLTSCTRRCPRRPGDDDRTGRAAGRRPELRCASATAAPLRSRTSSCGRKSSTSTTSASRARRPRPRLRRTATSRRLEAIPELTRAAIFQRRGIRTEAFVRFDGGRQPGSPDLARDVRGFAVKLYTPEGNWDIVGNNIPVFFIQDAMKFPDLVHRSRRSRTAAGYVQAASAHDTFWDFISLMPEATHMVLWTMSDRAIPRSLRFMEGFGVHTFRFVNAWRGNIRQVPLEAAAGHAVGRLGRGGQDQRRRDPDFHRRDLWNAIQAGDFPQGTWVQVFDDEFADPSTSTSPIPPSSSRRRSCRCG